MSSPKAQASLIGVAIACTGNILISLALTIQKLAHQRHKSEWQEHVVVVAASGHSTADQSPAPHEFGSLPASVLVAPDPARDLHAALAREQERQVEAALQTPQRPQLMTESVVSRGASPPSPSDDETAYLRSRLWWFGLALMALGEAGNFLSYGFAPASVVAPLGTVALIANCVFAPLVLGESFTGRNVLGVALAILGAVTIVWSSRNDNKRLSPDELLEAITALPFVVYTCINFSLLFPLTFLSSGPWGDMYIVIDIGLCALFGGYTVMATKALSSLLSTELILALKYPITWAAIFVLVATSVLQIKFLNRALMRFESKEVIPTQFVFFSLSAIIGSAVLYQEFRGVSKSDFVNFAFGVATTFLGVYFLTTPSEQPQTVVIDEEAPLLTPERRLSSFESASPAMTTPLPHDLRSPSLVPAGQRLMKRASNPSLNIGLAVNSPAGLYLLATTPPASIPALPTTATATRHRTRGMSTDSGLLSPSLGPGSSPRLGRGRSGTVSRVLERLIRK